MTMRGLPAGITVFERGWLSSNNILFLGEGHAALVDTGYVTHADQTVALVRHALAGQALNLLVNTHLHSDHCGGNAALQRAYPELVTMIPPGLAQAVATWDTTALTYEPTGQSCERFSFDATLSPGTNIRLGRNFWQVHAAPGHDPHSVVLFEPHSGVLVSADALWENGFGVVFPELEGVCAFGEVAATLDLIESLRPRWVIPGHGRVFGGVDDLGAAMARARSRLQGFVTDPSRHARHAAKVLLKFKLLELQTAPWKDFTLWALDTPYLKSLISHSAGSNTPLQELETLAQDLVRAGVARLENGFIFNT